jgi:hypothetical protein
MIGCRLTYTCPQAQQRDCESHSHIILALLHASEPGQTARRKLARARCGGGGRARCRRLATGSDESPALSRPGPPLAPSSARRWEPQIETKSRRPEPAPARAPTGSGLAGLCSEVATVLLEQAGAGPPRLAGRHHHDDEGLPKGPFKLGPGSRRLRVGLSLAAGPATLRLGLDRDPDSDSEVSLRAPAGVPAGAS